MAKVEVLTNESGAHKLYCVYCTGCKCNHGFDERWIFNNDFEKPTFSPSMLVNAHMPEKRCHSFVRDGKIQYLNDCWHELKGQTLDLEDIDEDMI